MSHTRPLAARALLAGAFALALGAPAAGAAPFGFTTPITPPSVDQHAVTTAAAVGPDGAGIVAWGDAGGSVHEAPVSALGQVGPPVTLATGQGDMRDLQAVVSDRGEPVLVWASYDRVHGQRLSEISASASGQWDTQRQLEPVRSATSAMPRLAALKGGVVAAIWRDRLARHNASRVVYARRAPGKEFGTGRSLGFDATYAQIVAAPGGAALVSYQRGPLAHRTAYVARAARGALVPGPGHAVAGLVRLGARLAGDPGGTAVLSWVTRGSTPHSRTREVAPAIGPVRELPAGQAGYGPARVALSGMQALTTWSGYAEPLGFQVFAAGTLNAGPWSAPVALHTAPSAEDGQPTPAILGDGTTMVTWASASEQPGVPLFDVVVGDPGNPGTPGVLGPTTGPVTVALGHAGGRVLLAWPAPTGGVSIATRAG